MKVRPLFLVLIAGAVAIAIIWWQAGPPKPTVLAFRLGHTFEQVVKDSTYPVYGMTFRLKCTEGCWTREPPYLFLIDVW